MVCGYTEVLDRQTDSLIRKGAFGYGIVGIKRNWLNCYSILPCFRLTDNNYAS